MGKDVNRITASYRFGGNTTGVCGADHAVWYETRQEKPIRKTGKKPPQESLINRYCGGSKSWSSALSQSRYWIFYSI